MAKDLYQSLGVPRTASDDEIRKAYRKLAKEFHPDLHPGDKNAEERFKTISAAYAILGDADKRARYDRGEIDDSGQERPPEGMYRYYAESPRGRAYQSRAGYADFADMGDIFADLFGSEAMFAEGRGRRGPRRGVDLHYRLAVGFLDAVNGAKKRLTMPDGKTLDVTVPAGLRDGQMLRLKGQGQSGEAGAAVGDALVEIAVEPHPFFRRDGDDIRVEVPVSLTEAVLGGKIRVPTVEGPVDLTVPKGANTGTVLRLRGKGVRKADGGRGDQLVELKVMLPPKPDPGLEDLVKKWGASYPVRRDLGV